LEQVHRKWLVIVQRCDSVIRFAGSVVKCVKGDFDMLTIKGGVTRPKGFTAVGTHVGIKAAPTKDLAILVSEVPALAKATFTTNTVKAASVLWDMELMKAGEKISAVVINSGNANACTGSAGHDHVQRTAATCARSLGLQDREVFVCSTGVIGVPLPVDKVCNGLEAAVSKLSDDTAAGRAAAEAILTTDTRSKEVAVEVDINGVPVRIGGMAKGSGMIHPNMATMLSFITTDALISEEALEQLVQESVHKTYNMISVDGDTSTNDTVLALANGLAGNPEITSHTDGYEAFRVALDYVNTELATSIVRDGEGATKFLEVTVSGAANSEDARRLAKAVITSNLVKTAFFGADANWGRIVSAMGQSGQLNWELVTITVESTAGSIKLLQAGEPLQFDENRAKSILSEYSQKVLVEVGNGLGVATAWGCDLSYEYVKINGDYRT
jgi:glutamate N-acetyltransferase/amino-acid N-acetyltransferase